MPLKHFPMPILSFSSGRTSYYARFDRCWNSGSASETEPVLTARCRYFPPTVFVCRYSSESAQVPPSSKPSFLAYLGTFGQLIGVLLQDTGTQVSPEGLGSSHRLRRLPSTIWVSTPLHVSTVSHCLLLRCFPHVELLCAREQAQATVMA